MDDEEPNGDGGADGVPTYSGPPTVEEQLSPFYDGPGAGGRTLPGAPPPGFASAPLPTPKIRSRTPTVDGIGGAPAPVMPPRILNAPPSSSPPAPAQPPLDGPTLPDGVPMMSASDTWEMPTDPSQTFEDEGIATVPNARPLAGHVPARDAPNVEISKSLEWDVSNLNAAPPEGLLMLLWLWCFVPGLMFL